MEATNILQIEEYNGRSQAIQRKEYKYNDIYDGTDTHAYNGENEKYNGKNLNIAKFTTE